MSDRTRRLQSRFRTRSGLAPLTAVLLSTLAGCGESPDQGVIRRLESHGCRVDVAVRDTGEPVFKVTCAPGDLHPQTVGLLHQLPNLGQLSLSGATLDDAGLGQLAGLAQLEVLNLRGTQISDAGLAQLAGFTQLKLLNLTATGVSSDGLAALRPLERLEMLHLAETRVGDAGLPSLSQLDRLKTVTLQGTPVTPRGVAGLRKARPDLRVVH